MRFIHTADLHIGKVVNGFSMLEEQQHALNQVIAYVKERRADAVLLSGDLYDRSVPPAAAVSVLDEFLTMLVDMGIQVLAISGNHDCGERIGFAGGILKKRGLYMTGKLSDPVEFVDVKDEWGGVRIHMLPFARPAQVKAFYHAHGEESPLPCAQGKSEESPLNTEKAERMRDDFQGAMEELLSHISFGPSGRDVLLTHQFVMGEGKGPELSDSETRVAVGGTDQVDVKLFHPFAYTALGHIHGCQQIGKNPVYYSGSPVKYSFSEVFHSKCVIFGEIGKDGKTAVEKLPLRPIHDMRKIRGRLAELIASSVVEEEEVSAEDYLLAVLTDEGELIDPIGTLRSVYPNVMQLQWEKKSSCGTETRKQLELRKEKEPFALFQDFFFDVTGRKMTQEQQSMIRDVVERAKEEME